MVNINEKVKEGHIHAKIIVELLGKPKEHVEETLKNYIKRIKANPNLTVLNEDYADAKEREEEMWSTFVELEMLLKDLITLMNFCFDYMPSSVDIIAPSELKLNERHMTHFLNDLQGRLHDVDMRLKQANSENSFLKRNMHTILRNMLVVVLHNNPKSITELSTLCGVPGDDLEEFMAALAEENLVKKENGKYLLVKK